MISASKLAHGSSAWFEMAGSIMCDAATRAALPKDVNLSLVERYTDGVELSAGRLQGLYFAIVGGKPSFRIGARADERADITVAVTAAAAHALNLLPSADPAYRTALGGYQSSGEMRIDGDFSLLGDWFDAVHDRIVERTA